MFPCPDLGPKPALGYIANPLQRAAERRGNAGFLAGLEKHRDARAYAVGGEMVVLKKAGNGFDPLFTLTEARSLGKSAETVFLGVLDGGGRFGIGLDPAGTNTSTSPSVSSSRAARRASSSVAPEATDCS